uniref:Cytosolic iron-sulfur assembly component 2B n=1 Tax=Bos mutus grunniens TaxID=30521 RepID=A0A8B9YY96_BOSMU
MLPCAGASPWPGTRRSKNPKATALRRKRGPSGFIVSSEVFSVLLAGTRLFKRLRGDPSSQDSTSQCLAQVEQEQRRVSLALPRHHATPHSRSPEVRRRRGSACLRSPAAVPRWWAAAAWGAVSWRTLTPSSTSALGTGQCPRARRTSRFQTASTRARSSISTAAGRGGGGRFSGAWDAGDEVTLCSRCSCVRAGHSGGGFSVGKGAESSFLHLAHLIRSINDPEHPLTLEELNVVEQVRVQVSDPESTVAVAFTPTIPHCSMATLIGLSIKVKLLRSLPQRFKMDVHITPGTHASEHAVNKQLADKERVAAALENTHLLEVVNQCLSARS